MKLHAAIYKSPYPTQGRFENVFIQDVYYKINRIENLFVVKFQMYYEHDSKRIILDENQLSFKGTNIEIGSGLATSNKTAIIKVTNVNYNPEIPQIIEVANPEYDVNISPTLEVENPDYDANIEGSLPTITIPNPDYKPFTIFIANPDYVPQFEELPLLQYLQSHQGQFPEVYEVIDFGYPTYEDAIQYFTGGELGSPELFLINDFAKEWLKNNLQMKGEIIGKQFNFLI